MRTGESPPLVLIVDGSVDQLDRRLGAVRASLRGQVRVQGAATGALARALLIEAESSAGGVAVVAAERRLPDAPGVAVLELARAMYPRCRRLLLASTADAAHIEDTAVTAHLPGHVGANQLAGEVTTALRAWSEPAPPPARAVDAGAGIRLVSRADAASYAVRDFFARNSVPHRVVDADSAEGRALLDELEVDGPLPVLATGDGRVLTSPTPFEIATALGEPAAPARDDYDVLIVGAGPAGLAAAVNAASEGIATLMVDRLAPGGQAGTSNRIENYVGFPLGITGADLATRAMHQALRLGAHAFGPAETVSLEVDDVSGGRFVAELDTGHRVSALAVVLATGLEWNRLEVPGAERFVGRGLYYGSARAAAPQVSGGEVHVVGGANSAGQAAVFLAGVARHVTVLCRGRSLADRMSAYLVEQLESLPNVTIRLRSSITAMVGDDRLEEITIAEDGVDGALRVPTDGVFTFIGARPDSGWLTGLVDLDEHGFVRTGEGARGRYATSRPGVFAVGDVRAGSIKRVSSAVGEGVAVVPDLHEFLAGRREVARSLP